MWIFEVDMVELVSDEQKLTQVSPVRFQADLEHSKQLDMQASYLFSINAHRKSFRFN
jgi:hypothetical protein